MISGLLLAILLFVLSTASEIRKLFLQEDLIDETGVQHHFFDNRYSFSYVVRLIQIPFEAVFGRSYSQIIARSVLLLVGMFLISMVYYVYRIPTFNTAYQFFVSDFTISISDQERQSLVSFFGSQIVEFIVSPDGRISVRGHILGSAYIFAGAFLVLLLFYANFFWLFSHLLKTLSAQNISTYSAYIRIGAFFVISAIVDLLLIPTLFLSAVFFGKSLDLLPAESLDVLEGRNAIRYSLGLKKGDEQSVTFALSMMVLNVDLNKLADAPDYRDSLIGIRHFTRLDQGALAICTRLNLTFDFMQGKDLGLILGGNKKKFGRDKYYEIVCHWLDS